MMALSQNGGFGNGNWMWMMFMWILFPWIFGGNNWGNGGFGGNNGTGFLANQLNNAVIIVNKTSSFAQLINTISHEYYHLICHISKTLNIEDEEELANLNGNLNMRSYKIVRKLERSRF